MSLVLFTSMVGLIIAPEKVSFTVSIISLFAVGTGSASFFYGARANGMGTAFVGFSGGASSLYWNPASLADIKGWNIDMEYGQDWDVAEDSQKLLDAIWNQNPYNWEVLPPPEDRQELANNLNKLDDYSWNVRGGTRAGLVDVDGELIVVNPFDHLVASSHDGLGHLRVEAAELHVGHGAGPLHDSE